MSSLAKLDAAIEKKDTTDGKLSLKNLIDSQTKNIAKALPASTGLTPDRLAMIAYTLVRTTPQLGTCTPQSLLGALMTTAQLGLEPGPLQHVYFIPRWNKNVGANEVNFQIGYKGMIELARRAGVQIKTRTVYEHDEFTIEFGFEDRVIHKPTLGERGDVKGYYLTATWNDGASVLWMNTADVEKIRLRSDSGKQGKGPWSTDYDAMARKTLVRQAFASNSIPTTQVIAQALNVDETVRRDITPEALDEPAQRDEIIDAEIVEPEPQPQVEDQADDSKAYDDAIASLLEMPDDVLAAAYKAQKLKVPADELRMPDWLDELASRILPNPVAP